MMKIVAVMGGARKGQTCRAVSMFEQHLKAMGEVDLSYIYLRNVNLQPCRGCGLCLMKGEEYCPQKDDRDMLLQAILEADGVIFATPNYALQVTALLKNFFDRFSYIFHRPCMFHKTAIAVVTQGVYGGGDIVKYINSVADFWGFRVSPGVAVTTPWGVVNSRTEWPQAEYEKIDKKLKAAAERFYRIMSGNNSPQPGLKKFLLFRLVRTGHKFSKERARDYDYYRDKGWFEMPYYYETNLGLFKRGLGALVDKLIASQAKKE